MKNTNKKVIAIVAVLFISLALMNITYAFPKMDICNYTNGDHSGDYYDGLCTKDGALAEEETKYSFLSKNINIITKNTISKLKHVDAYNGSSSNIFINTNTKKDEEIKKLKEIISKQNLLLKKYKEENNKLKQYIRYISKKSENKTINSSNINSKITIQDINISNLSREERKEYIRQLIIEKNKNRK